MKRISTRRCIGFISLSILISWILSITVNLDKYELGAVYNIFVPPMVGLITIVLFLVPNAISKSPKTQAISLIVCCLINLGVGIIFHFELSEMPFGR